MSDEKQSPIIRTSTYTVELYEHEDGNVSMKRTNDGFNSIELLGVLQLTQLEILQQIQGSIKPSKIERNLIDPKPPTP